MKVKTLIIASALAAGMSGAQAADYAFAMPLNPELPFSAAVPVFGAGLFADNWSFTAPATAATVSGAAISVNLTPYWNIEGILIELYDSADMLIATGATGTGTAITGASVMGGADYYFKVTGDVAGAPNGFYTFTAVSAVPEPGTYAMLMAGIGIVGLLVMRRRRDED
jgi:hypothetical protein